MNSIEVLDPRGEVEKSPALECNPIKMPLAGCRIGILDNSKPNFRRLATLVAERFHADGGAREILHFRKENPAVGAGDTLLGKIAQSADLVFTGSAD